MCAVSMIGDHYRDKWDRQWPGIGMPQQLWNPLPGQTVPASPISRSEFDALKKDVEEMKALLKRAKKYDEDNGEPNCEIDEKMDLLRRVAKLVGIDIDDVIGKRAAT